MRNKMKYVSFGFIVLCIVCLGAGIISKGLENINYYYW